MTNPFNKNNILDSNEYISKKSIRNQTKYFSNKENKCYTKQNSKKNNMIVRTVNQSNKLKLSKGFFWDRSKYICKETFPKNLNDGNSTVVESKKCCCIYICTCNKNNNSIKEDNLLSEKALLKIPKDQNIFQINQTSRMLFSPLLKKKH